MLRIVLVDDVRYSLFPKQLQRLTKIDKLKVTNHQLEAHVLKHRCMSHASFNYAEN